MYDLIILGGGPAGLTAAVYAMSKRLEALLVTEDLGGKAKYRMHVHGLEGYETINGEEVVRKFQSQVEYVDFSRLMDKIVSVEAFEGPAGGERFRVKTEGGKTVECRAIIVATGAMPRMLEVPREFELIGRGLSYSAISHAPLFWGKDTVVIGGGELAMRSTTELATLAKSVTLVAPEKLPDESPWCEKVTSFENVTTVEGAKVVGLLGDDYVSGVTIESADGERRDIAAEGVFVELGLIPSADIVKDLVEINELGQIVVDNKCETSRPGIFAAGDVTDNYSEQVLIAVGDGAKAALASYEYLLRHPKHLTEPPPEAGEVKPWEEW